MSETDLSASGRPFVEVHRLRWLYVLVHLLQEAGAARRDARIRFLKAQVEILRRKLGGNRVVLNPDDRAALLAIGLELDHRVDDVLGIVTPKTYCRWVVEQREGRRPKFAGRPKIARNLCELVKRLAVVSQFRAAAVGEAGSAVPTDTLAYAHGSAVPNEALPDGG